MTASELWAELKTHQCQKKSDMAYNWLLIPPEIVKKIDEALRQERPQIQEAK